jgi:hypothetical protein
MPGAGLLWLYGPSNWNCSPTSDVKSSVIVALPCVIIPPVLQKCRLKDISVPTIIPDVGLADFTSDKTGGIGVIVGVGQKFLSVTVDTWFGKDG